MLPSVVQQLDTAEGLYERPCNAFVAGFIGESNRLAGTVDSVRDGEARITLDGGGEVIGRAADADTAGTRALTHRGVDAEAGLPVGSTSYYCRRRVDLLALALRRHAELDLQALGRLGALTRPGSASALAAALANGLGAWMRSHSREQLATRFELFLAASHEPTLTQLIDDTRPRFLGMLAQILKAHGIARPRSVAGAVIALVEGTLLERVRSDKAPLRTSELRAWLEKLFSVH